MSNAAKALELLKRNGKVSYNTLARGCKNPPDTVYKLRRKGHTIQAIWATTRSGKRHVVAYAYHSAL